MKQKDTLAEFERRAHAIGTPLYKIAMAAGLAPSTYYRWKAGASGTHDNVQAVRGKLEEFEANRPRPTDTERAA